MLRVLARKRVTEGGGDECPGDTKATFPDKNYIHAEPGDVGDVIHVTEKGVPTVRLKKTGTATIVDDDEVGPDFSVDYPPAQCLGAIKALLLHSWEGTEYCYENLTAEEKSRISRSEFERLKSWINGVCLD